MFQKSTGTSEKFVFVGEGKCNLPKKKKKKKCVDRRERGVERGQGRERGNYAKEMIPPPIEIHTWLQATALKIPSTKSPRKYTVSFHFSRSFFDLVASAKKKKEKRRQEE